MRLLPEHPLGSEVVAIPGPRPHSWTADESAGYFVGNLDARFIGARRILLLSDFLFVDLEQGIEWPAPSGIICDGSSIPWYVQLFCGSPFVGLHRFPSAPHDYACVKKDHPSEKVHRMYYNGCRAAGAENATTLYRGILLGGPRFPGRAAV